MPQSVRELLELERQRRARIDRALGGVAEAVRSIATASARLDQTLRDWFSGSPAADVPAAPASSRAGAGEPNADVPARDDTAWDEALRKLDELSEESNTMATRLLSVVDIADQLDRRLGAAREIAERIDLLALNAALEATRSDPAARGAARSASEIRDQVVRWIRASQELGPLANEIREELGRAVLAADAAQRRATAARQYAATVEPPRRAVAGVVPHPSARGEPAPFASAPSAASPADATDLTLEQAERITTALANLGSQLDELLGTRS
ncbi:MAG: hypothetical protein U0610_15250 [bacterium]